MAAYLSANEAAQQCGVSPKTVRRWLQSGRLTAVKRGRSFRIPAEQIAPMVDMGLHDETPSADSGQETNGTVSPMGADGLSDRGHDTLVALVADQANTINNLIGKAEAAAMWQARAEMLAGELADARGRLAVLEAPKEGLAAEEPPITVDTVAPAEERPRVSWWRRVLLGE
jgi:excisionase family DNA binding protein